ncbi:methyltransferase [Planctopirus limnophila DSM 3776]|uniref:Methyltransferase n=1 Tax=Planctopirus limnophila (strain ATCC 43296 / DSM 3776 / IFAM 1008 / Mu 290) TaxID=521674 RepID=D5SMI9_PLAL2|nr:RsmD family RNA methyltransferase [Planctopirus limnophila]ADG65909.1 methyltransferase [Planctopirus limnophila DSM 3776]
MRIISGRFRRRTLQANPGNTTRPITDRAKVILFDNIERFFKGQRVLDIFCGTGSLGLEALSRGADTCVFIEQDHRAFELLKANIAHVGATEIAVPWRVSALKSSLKPRGTDWYPYGLVFFDPPYVMLKDVRPGEPLYRMFLRLARPDITTEDVLVVLRGPEGAEYTLPDCWQIERNMKVGSMELALIRKAYATPLPENQTDEDSGVENDEPQAGN